MSEVDVNNFLSTFDISRETIESLKNYQELVIKWNKTINLVSNNSLKGFWERHIVDSLQLIKFIDNKDISIIDVGSGAGLPGIILSIAGIKNVTLVESDSRKSAFLLQAAGISSNKINIVNNRIENISLNCDILTCRAWTNIDNILNLTSNIKVNDRYLLLKGESYEGELEVAKQNWKFDYTETDSITSATGKVIEIKNIVRVDGN
jgi:16S rRNA (guanine527-N7)-methyltransferase